uniref:ARAD1C26378p n=1 Tax=Blastobotrys adeninivorans TaxID=409370 RepID=A0A060T777_BLAAD
MCPGRYGPVYRKEGDSHVVDFYKWGLVPFFSTEQRTFNTFNCRDDALIENRGMWTPVKQHHRCIVLAEGYYEWKKESKKRIPYYIKRKDGKLLCMAGLWDVNTKVTEDGEELFSYTVITTTAHKGINWLHDRMPVIWDPVDDKDIIDTWLNEELAWKDDPQLFTKGLKSFDSSKLEVYEVSSDVGKIGNSYKELTMPVKKGNIKDFFSNPKKGKPQESSKEETKEPKELSEPENKEPKGSEPPLPKEPEERESQAEKDKNAIGTETDKPAGAKRKTTSGQSPRKKLKPSTSPTKQKSITSFFSK